MKSDKFGNIIYENKDIIDLMYKDQFEFLDKIFCEDNSDLQNLKNVSELNFQHLPKDLDNFDIDMFDQEYQKIWEMPEDYKTFDIEHWILDQCNTPQETKRANDELAEFKTRNMLPLLCWLKYLVDTCRENKIVWGVGRGSSVSSFVLYKIGVHKIDPIKYDLDWQDFLR